MELNRIRQSVLALAALLMLSCPASVYSCEPFAEVAVFNYPEFPNMPPDDFAAGKLGILLPNLKPRYLVVAYRYLAGIPLTAEQQRAALSLWSGDMRDGNGATTPKEAQEWWLKMRSQVPGVTPGEEVEVYASAGNDPYQNFLNCPADAFLSAGRTLNDRLAKLGEQNPEIRDWVEAQDEVFANCPGMADRIPQAPSRMNAVLRSDRDYQVAAAWFYSLKYDDAAARFDQIAKDPSSPWSHLAAYLAARCFIRKATLFPPVNEPFDRAAMNEARVRLQKILADQALSDVYHAAQDALGFVLARTDPAARAVQLENDLMKTNTPDFRQELWDFGELYSLSPKHEGLADWISSFGGGPRSSNPVVVWQKSKSLAWLISALAEIHREDPALPDAIAAATQVPANSPAYLSVHYYLARLFITTGKPDQARRELDGLFNNPAVQLSMSQRNLLVSERQKVAADFADFLKFAPEQALATDYDMEDDYAAPPEEPATPTKNAPAYFSVYAAGVFDQAMPLSMFIEAAKSAQLPTLLRRELVRAAWTRAVLLKDQKSALELQPLIADLDHPLWKEMSIYRDAAPDRKPFIALLLILRNPGLRPYVVAGLPRKTTLGEIDEYRDNWWCHAAHPDAETPNAEDVRRNDVNFPFPEFESQRQSDQAAKEVSALSSIETAPDYLTHGVLKWAQRHPEDSDVPEALHWAIRSTRYGACTGPATSEYSKAAFDLLHRRYPRSEWTLRTKYRY